MPRKRSAETTPALDRLAPDLLVDDFGENALIFLASRELGDNCALLYDPDTGDVRTLNPTDTAVCKLINGRRTVTGIMEILKESFEGMDANADRQVLALIEEPYRAGAIGTLKELK